MKTKTMPINYICPDCGRKKTQRVVLTSTYIPRNWICPRCKSTMINTTIEYIRNNKDSILHKVDETAASIYKRVEDEINSK